jgi:hypothetical protein
MGCALSTPLVEEEIPEKFRVSAASTKIPLQPTAIPSSYSFAANNQPHSLQIHYRTGGKTVV